MTEFTPVTGLLGGMLIGLAAVWLAAAQGRIAGISGILGGLFTPNRANLPWQLAFIVGLLVAPTLHTLWLGEAPRVDVLASWPVLIAGGLAVGFGTRMAGGCTSGHGVCGLGRFSARSLVATATFMAAAGVTVFLIRHVVGG